MLECCYDVILQGSICLTVIGYFFYCIFQWQLALQPSKKLVILYSLWVLAVMIWLCLSAMWMEIKLSWISMMFQPLEVLYVVLLQNDTVLWHSFVNCLFCFVLQLWFVSLYTSQCIWLPLINFSSFQNTSNAKFGDTILTSDAGTHCLELSFKSANNKLSSYKYLPTSWL